MSGLYTRFAAGMLFPLHERLKRHSTGAMRRELERTQWLERGQLESLQAERLQALLTRCAERVPYYRRVFAEHDIRAASIKSLADLARIPFLTKELIRAHAQELRADDAGPLVKGSTGGSTGQPLAFYLGMDRVSHDVAAKWRATRWWSVDIGDPEVVVWGSPVELHAQDRVRQFRDRLFRSRLLPAFQMSPSQMDGYLDYIERTQPYMMSGYPSALARLAERARSTGRDLGGFRPKVAFVTGEMLYCDQKRAIVDVFGCPVANGYGARDAGFLAHDCPRGGLHVGTEYIVMELIGRDGQPVPTGTPGEVVITHLASGDFPFVRYRTGDMAVASGEACDCGRGLPLLASVEGRRNDWVLSRSGELMHGASVTYVLRDAPGVQAFKVVQQRDLSLDVQVVSDRGLEESVRQHIAAQLEARIGAGTDVRIQLVDEIPAEASGKYRFVISHA